MPRDGIEVEYEVFLAEDGADGLESMNWTGFLGIGAQVGAATRLLKNHAGLKVEKQILKVAFCKVKKLVLPIESPRGDQRRRGCGARGILIKQRVEQVVRAHEHSRFPLFEQ